MPEAHRLERRLQRQDEAILAQGDVFVLQVGRVLLRAHQLLGVLAHPGRQLLALAPQPEQLVRGAVAQLAGGVEGVAGVEHDAFVGGQLGGDGRQPRGGRPRGDSRRVQAGEAPADVDRHLALVGHLAQLLGPQGNASLDGVQVGLDLREAERGQHLARAQQGHRLGHVGHAGLGLARRGRQAEGGAGGLAPDRLGLGRQARQQLGPVEELQIGGLGEGRRRGGERGGRRRNSHGLAINLKGVFSDPGRYHANLYSGARP